MSFRAVFHNWKENFNSDMSKEALKDLKAFSLNFGPQHPAAHGVLRMVLELNGEIVDKLDTHIGLLHRGTEKLIESKRYLLGLPYFDRLDYVSMLSQEHSYCLGIEGLNNSENNNYYNLNLRTIFDELTRILNHMLALSCHALDIGSMSSIFWAFEEREKVMEFYERLSGARMHAAFYRPFEFNNGYLSKSFMADILNFARGCITTLNEIHNMLTFNKIWKHRLVNVGVLGLEDVKNYSLSGVLARSTGLKADLRLRKIDSYGSYYNLTFKTFLGFNGDCYDRYLIRLNEMVESLHIVNQVIADKMIFKEKYKFTNTMNPDEPYGTVTTNIRVRTRILKLLIKEKTNLFSYNFIKMSHILEHFKKWSSGFRLKKNVIYKSIESPKGEFGVTLIGVNSSYPFRCKIRSPSYYNLNLIVKAVKGHFLADLVTLIGTIDIVFGEVDR